MSRARVLLTAQVANLWAEYQQKPYNISERARALGVKPPTLAYHLRGGKAWAITRCTSWRGAVKRANRFFRLGDRKAAAEMLREAAARMEAEMKK